MMSVEVIIAVNNEIARKAAQGGTLSLRPLQRRRSGIAVFVPQHRLAEASWLEEDRRDLVRGQDRAWV